MNKCCDSNALSSIVIIARRMCSSNFQQFGAPIRRNYRIRRNYKAYTFKQSQHDTRILWCEGQLKYLQSSVAFMDILPASNRHCSSIQIRDCTLVASTPVSLVWALLSSSCLHTCFHSGYDQGNKQAAPCFNFAQKTAVQCWRTVQAGCCISQVCGCLAGHHMEQHGDGWDFQRTISSVRICTTVTIILPESNNYWPMHNDACNINTTR